MADKSEVRMIETDNLNRVPRDGHWYQVLPDQSGTNRYVRWNLDDENWNIITQDIKQ